ncbi:MAG: LysM peptidoglycan-binding domain-containing protein [Patescibacteria group bacterium]|jgi:nucleoid-associated protein YgaU
MVDIESQAKKLLKKADINESTFSTILGGLVVFIVGLLIINYIRTLNSNERITEKAAATVNAELLAEVAEKQFPKTYVVKEGDHLWEIAEAEYGNGEVWVKIASENNLVFPNRLFVGQELVLPEIESLLQGEVLSAESVEAFKGNSYMISEGDTLWQISMKAYGRGDKWVEIAEANNLAYPDYLLVGSTLKIPR